MVGTCRYCFNSLGFSADECVLIDFTEDASLKTRIYIQCPRCNAYSQLSATDVPMRVQYEAKRGIVYEMTKTRTGAKLFDVVPPQTLVDWQAFA